MKYTQRQWDREIGWGKVPEEYKHKEKEKPRHPYWEKQLGLEGEELTTKLEEYKDKINYDVWSDATSVPYNITVNYSMKANEYVQSRTDKPTRSNNRNDKS
tara:strand:- start:367 stop:669 length:303 start_codon:yes stop_codon:yes gene_type:complete